MPIIELKSAEQARESITRKQQTTIKKMYQDIADKLQTKVNNLEGRVFSDSIVKKQINDIQKELEKDLMDINRKLHVKTNDGMNKVSQAVIDANKNFLVMAGFSKEVVAKAWIYTPRTVIESIATGNVYKSDWSLSEAIWGHTKSNLDDINRIIASGVKQGLGSYDIAKDLEKYVNPSKRKSWEWSKVYPNTAKKVDYNAQRLARTLVSHAYQQTFVATAEKNPFFIGYIWQSAGIHGRTCELCLDRDGQFFPKDDLPLDHPNGLCTFTVSMDKSMSEVKDDIANWYNSPAGTYPELDAFADSL